jgi:hypothetical protein
MLQAKLSYDYNKVNNVFDYCALEIYVKAFIKTALGGDMPLTSTSDGQFPAERTTDAQCIRDLA